MYDRDSMPLPAAAGDDPNREPAYMGAIRERFGITDTSPEAWREITATYYGMISRMDDQLGRPMGAVDASR